MKLKRSLMDSDFQEFVITMTLLVGLCVFLIVCAVFAGLSELQGGACK